MTLRQTTLANGLRIVTEQVAAIASIAMGFFVGTGSRAEQTQEHGLAHLLEHMAFKGTPTRSARDIAAAIEDVGGDINAATSLEQTAYTVRLLAEDMPRGIDILSDIVLNSVFDSTELEREKNVILQELAASLDNPDDVIFDLLQKAAFGTQPLGRAILGTASSITGFTRETIAAFLQKHYHAGRCVLAAAGGVDHDDFVARAERAFAHLPAGQGVPLEMEYFVGQHAQEARPLEQVQLAYSFPGLRWESDDLYALNMFGNALGGGMSSRLFQEAREKRGLCYSIAAFHWPFQDTGVFGVHAACGPADVAALNHVVLDVMAATANTLTAEEMGRAKAQMKAGLLMGQEYMTARTERLARHMLLFNRVIGLDEIRTAIDAVTLEDIKSVGNAVVQSSHRGLAALGPQAALAHLN